MARPSGKARFSRLATAFLAVTVLAPLHGQDTFDEAARSNRVIHARPLEGPIRLDGILDEPFWKGVEPATGFTQREPDQGQPASENTEIRILYDSEALYFGISAFDSEPDRLIVNSLRRDFVHRLDDGVSLYLDTFNDDRNAYIFYINPAAAKREVHSIDEGRDQNIEWEDVWDVETSLSDQGWFAEVRIPFRSLRFRDGPVQEWGFNAQRRVRRRNEQSDWAPVPRRFTGFHVSFAGTLKGIENVSPGRNLKLTPYISSQLRKLETDDLDSLTDVGVDLKYGLTTGLTLDGTLNTDFSQVEVDEQQVNLTRFSLFFPEKRDFFLENAGLFLFGQTGQRGASREIIPFFSRRIGLSAERQPVPILGGTRLTGKVGKQSLGLLNLQTRESGAEPANNFTVLRVKRNVLAQSEIGALFVNRQSDIAGDHNRTLGVDAHFRFWRNLKLAAFLAGTKTPGLKDSNLAGRFWAEWKTNLWEVRSGYLEIGENFNAEVGFVPRKDIRKSDTSMGWRPRPHRVQWIREFFPNARIQYITDRQNRLVTRVVDLEFATEFENSGSLQVGRTLRFERLDDPFLIRDRIEVSAGDYSFDHWYAELGSNPSAPLSASLLFESGDFWDGRRQGVELDLSFKPHYKFSVMSRIQWDRLRLTRGPLDTQLVNARIDYSFSTKMFLSALIQYDSLQRRISSNFRFNLIHRPLSDIFVVYNEQRDIFLTGQVDKSLTVKYTHMLDLL